MDAPRILLLPFGGAGYDDAAAAKQTAQIAENLTALGASVTASSRIDDAPSARAAAERYNPYCYDGAVLLPIVWAEPRLAAIAARGFFGKPIAVGCINEFLRGGARTEFSSAPAAAALYGSLREMGVKCEFVPEWDAGQLRGFFAAARALRVLRDAKLGFFGHNFNGITAADLDLSLLRAKFGTEVYSFDVSELLAAMARLTPESPAYREASGKVRAKIQGLPEAYFDRVVRMTGALQDYVRSYDLQALAVRCHTELSQTYGLTACLPLGILGDELPCSCEADLPVTVTELLLSALSDGKMPTYADLRTFTQKGMSVGACGFAPCGLTGGTAVCGGGDGYLTNSAALNCGRVTLARLQKRPGGGLLLHITEAAAQKEPGRLTEYGCAPYPMATIVPDQPMSEFIRMVGANHYAIVYDEVKAAAEVFCRYADIPVNL